MEANRENRVSRGYSFTFDSEEDKAKYHAHAKRKGTNLANLIKMLLAADMEASQRAKTGGGPH